MTSASSRIQLSYRTGLIAIVSAILLALTIGAQPSSAACPDFPTPYYESSCPKPPPGTPPAKPGLKFKLSKACKRKSLRVTPSLSGGIVTRVTASVNGKRVAKVTKAPFAFTVKLKKLKKGKRHQLKVAATFTTGETITETATFRTCS